MDALPLLVVYGAFVFWAGVGLVALATGVFVTRRRRRARRRQAEAARRELGPPADAPAPGPCVLEGTLDGEGEPLLRRHRRGVPGRTVEERASGLRLLTGSGPVAVEGAPTLEVGAEERLDRGGFPSDRRVLRTSVVRVRGTLVRRAGDGRDYRGTAAAWAFTGAEDVRVVARDAPRLRSSLAARLLPAVVGGLLALGAAVSASAALREADRGEGELTWRLQAAAALDPWGRAEALDRASWRLQRQVGEGHGSPDALVAALRLAGRPLEDAVRPLARGGWPERAEALLSERSLPHQRDAVAEAFARRGDFAGASRTLRDHPLEHEHPRDEVLFHLLAGELSAARAAQARRLERPARICLHAYLGVLEGDEGARRVLERHEDLACRVLRAERQRGPDRGRALAELTGAAPHPFSRAIRWLRALDCTLEDPPAAPCRFDGPARSAPEAALGATPWGYDAAPGLARAVAEALEGRDDPLARRLRFDALADLAVLDLLTGAPASAARRLGAMAALVEALGAAPDAGPPAGDGDPAGAGGLGATPEPARWPDGWTLRALRIHLRGLRAVLRLRRGDPAGAVALAHGPELRRLREHLRVHDPDAELDRARLSSDARALLAGRAIDVVDAEAALLAAVRGIELSPDSLRAVLRPDLTPSVSPPFAVRELRRSLDVARALGRSAEPYEPRLAAYRRALLRRETALPLLIAAR